MIINMLQVGRALAISALDMYQLNPWSRLPTTEYGSVAGIRQSLLQRIRTSRSKKYIPFICYARLLWVRYEKKEREGGEGII